MKHTLPVLAVMLLSICSGLAEESTLTLRSLGARGDGVTDDTAAIVSALKRANGKAVDGEGLIYAVAGSTRIDVPVDLKNATIKQTLAPFDTSKYIRSDESMNPPEVTPEDGLRSMMEGLPIMTAAATAIYAADPVVVGEDLAEIEKMLNVRTVFVRGESGPVAVKLENVKILGGEHPEMGMHSNSAGLYLVNCEPVILKDIEISGGGKGGGLLIFDSNKVAMEGVFIHDILWAPYAGDITFDAELMNRERAWNDMPIYDFDEKQGRFIRVRIQEQTNGLVLSGANEVEMKNIRIERCGAMVGGRFYPWQADGMTISGVKNLTMKDIQISNVWEGIDFTGHGVDGFVQENIQITDTFAFGFKYAHPQKNGKVINCTSTRAGLTGFTIGSESENIEFLNCAAYETGFDSHWGSPNIAGFEVAGSATENARNITIKDCVAENKEHAGAMAFGFLLVGSASGPEFNNVLINPRGGGASNEFIHNFRQ